MRKRLLLSDRLGLLAAFSLFAFALQGVSFAAASASSGRAAVSSPLIAQRQATYKNVSLSYDSSLASSVTGQTVFRNVDPNGPYWEQYPEHISMQFNGFPNVGEFNEALVRVYPVAEYLSIRRAQDLRRWEAGREGCYRYCRPGRLRGIAGASWGALR